MYYVDMKLLRKSLLVLLFSVFLMTELFASGKNLHIQESLLATGLGFTYETDNFEYTIDAELACLNTLVSMQQGKYNEDTEIHKKWLYALLSYNSVDAKILYKAYKHNNFEVNVGGTIQGSHYDLFGLGVPFVSTSITLNSAAKIAYRFNRFSAFMQTRVPLIGVSFNKKTKPVLQSILSNSNIISEIEHNISIGVSIGLGGLK